MPSPSRWIAHAGENWDAPVRLICFPYAGAGASLFKRWPQLLPAWLHVCPIQLPGRETRIAEPSPDDMAGLLEAMVEALLPFLDRPVGFFGHSMGAALAYEAAARLPSNDALELLVVSGLVAPHCRSFHPPLHRLSDDQLHDLMSRLGWTPPAVLANRELMALLMDTLRRDFARAATHQRSQAGPLACRILALASREDPWMPIESVAAWQAYTRSAFQFRELPGGHHFVHSAETEVVAAIAEELAPFAVFG